MEFIYFTKIDNGYIARIAGMRYQVCGVGGTEQDAAKKLMLQIEKCKDILKILNRGSK